MKNNKAFTLAETLVTLTIIGVVAALTIPTLLSRHQKHTYVVGLKKANSELVQAFKMMPLSENCSAGDYNCAGYEQGNINLSNLTLIGKQFKDSEIIDFPDAPNFPKAIRTANGMLIYYPNEPRLTNDLLEVDINGLNGPNQGGRDRFIFILAMQATQVAELGTIMPYGSKFSETYIRNTNPAYSGTVMYWNTNPDSPSCKIDQTNTMSYLYFPCAGRVLEEDAMNY